MDTVANRCRMLAATRGAQLPDAAAETLGRYVEALADVGRSLNLSAARSLDELLEVLVGPSLAVACAWPEGPLPVSIVDLGSGNGFPGVAAGLLWPGAALTLVERRGRKATAIRTCLERAGLAGRVLNCDARELRREAPELLRGVSLVTARGVGSLATVNRLAAPLLAPGGIVVHFKAHAMSVDERAAAQADIRELRLAPLDDLEFDPAPPGPGRLVRFQRRTP